MPRNHALLRLAVLPAVALLAAGCGGGSGDDSDGGSGSDADTVSAAGLTFAKPDGFKVLDPDKLADETSESDELDEAAKDLGMTADQLQAMVGQLDLYLIDQGGSEDGFSANINVIGQPGVDDLSEEDIQAQLEAVGAELTDVTTETTDAGDAVVATYTLSAGGRTVEGAGIMAPTEDGSAVVTVSSSDRATTDDLVEGILDTLDQTS